MFGNNRMAGILGMGLVSTRRYCFQFLGPDAGAGQHDGVARKLSRAEAFRVFLGVSLIRDARLTLEEARRIEPMLSQAAEGRGLLPAKAVEAPRAMVEAIISRAENEAGFYVEIKTTSKREKAGRGAWSEEYRIEGINPDPKSGAFPVHADHCSIVLNLTRLADVFLKREAG